MNTQFSGKANIINLEFTPTNQRKCAAALQKDRGLDSHATEAGLDEVADIVAGYMDPKGVQALHNLLTVDCPPSAIVIRNGPVDPNVKAPPLPGEDKREVKKTFVSENLALGIARLMGQPFGFAPEQEDSLVNDLVPRADQQARSSGIGSGDLGSHTEHGALRYFWQGGDRAPEALVITKIQSERNGEPGFYIQDSRFALYAMDTEEARRLKGPNFQHGLPQRFRPGRAKVWTDDAPILSMDPAGKLKVSAAFYGNTLRVVPGELEAACALEAFARALRATKVPVNLGPGDTIVIPNDVTLHGRNAYSPYFDEQGRASRWIQRVLVANSLAPFTGWETNISRVYNPD
ncbi:MAG: hypothetical protein ACPGOY_13430 [Rhodospirillaceae bacterium]